jgi:competence protein ComEC
MKRLGALLGFTSFTVLSFAYFLGESVVKWFFAPLVVAIIIFFVVKRLHKFTCVIVALVCALVSLGGYFAYTDFYYKDILQKYTQQEVKITASVSEEPYLKYGKYYYVLKTNTIDENDVSINILLRSTKNLKADVCDNLSFRGTLSTLNNDYYITKNCYFYDNVNDSFHCNVSTPESKSIKYYSNKLRDALENSVDGYMDSDQSAVCNAMCYGSKNSVSTEIKEYFRKAGVSHILVVSGLHMSIVSMLMLFIFSKLFKKRWLYCPLTACFVVFYMVMTGLSYSVIRSGIMVLIMLLAKMVYREVDSLNSLGIAMLIIIFTNPYSTGDSGLLLSVASTSGIIIFANPISNYIVGILKLHNKIIISVVQIITVTISATIAVLPINILLFSNVPLLSVFANLLIVPLVTPLIIITIIGSILGLTGAIAVYSPFLFVSNSIAKFIIYIAKVIAGVPYSNVKGNRFYIYVWLCLTLVLILVLIISKNYKGHTSIVLVMSIFVLLCGVISGYIVNYNKTLLSVYDTGTGTTVTVTDRDNTVILSCGGDLSHSDVTEKLDNSSQEYTLLSITDYRNSRKLYSDDIVSTFKFKDVFIYDNYADKNIPNAENVIDFKDDYNVKVGRMNIDYIVRGNAVFTYLKCNGSTLLILPQYGDCSLLDKKYQYADIVIADSKVYNSNVISADLEILCCTEDYYADIMENLQINANKIYTTFNGDFNSEMKVE